MCGEYCIDYLDQKVGTAVICENGLYYNIQASCKVITKEMLRLVLKTDAGAVDLGVMVPLDGKFVLSKDLPKKRIGEGKPQFCLNGNRDNGVLLNIEKPFSNLSALEDAVLMFRADEKYIVFREKSHSSSSTGQ